MVFFASPHLNENTWTITLVLFGLNTICISEFSERRTHFNGSTAQWTVYLPFILHPSLLVKWRLVQMSPRVSSDRPFSSHFFPVIGGRRDRRRFRCRRSVRSWPARSRSARSRRTRCGSTRRRLSRDGPTRSGPARKRSARSRSPRRRSSQRRISLFIFGVRFKRIYMISSTISLTRFSIKKLYC